VDSATLDLFLVHDHDDEDAASELARLLERQDTNARTALLDEARDPDLGSIDAPLEHAITVAVVSGGKGISPAHETALRKAHVIGGVRPGASRRSSSTRRFRGDPLPSRRPGRHRVRPQEGLSNGRGRTDRGLGPRAGRGGAEGCGDGRRRDSR
jgi:hypothetical protein